MTDQVSQNYKRFRELLPDLIRDRKGQHALLHAGQVEGFFSTSIEAILSGVEQFGEGNFSVEPVTYEIEDLGFYSHVGSALHA